MLMSLGRLLDDCHRASALPIGVIIKERKPIQRINTEIRIGLRAELLGESEKRHHHQDEGHAERANEQGGQTLAGARWVYERDVITAEQRARCVELEVARHRVAKRHRRFFGSLMKAVCDAHTGPASCELERCAYVTLLAFDLAQLEAKLLEVLLDGSPPLRESDGFPLQLCEAALRVNVGRLRAV